jgi:hypothetical protein
VRSAEARATHQLSGVRVQLAGVEIVPAAQALPCDIDRQDGETDEQVCCDRKSADADKRST